MSLLASEISLVPTIPSRGWQVLIVQGFQVLCHSRLCRMVPAFCLIELNEMQQENPFGYCVLSSHYN